MTMTGKFRIKESLGLVSRRPIFTVQYMAPEDHPGYGVWEDVTSWSSREKAQKFIDNPPDWWTRG